MAITQTENAIKEVKRDFFKDFPWFNANIYQKIQNATKEFFEKDFKLRFMGVTYSENLLFYGDEYFVNELPLNNQSNIEIRISSNVVGALLDNAIGTKDDKFKLEGITDIEGMLINEFTVFLCQSISEHINKAEINKRFIKNPEIYNFTFYVSFENKHLGKIILTIPEYLFTDIQQKEFNAKFDINDFKKTSTQINVEVGSAKITLEDVKALENGDIVVLDESNINKMAVLIDGKTIPFKIAPNPSIIMKFDNNGGNEMAEETNVNSQNMWDSILVDIVAEFNNVKLTLGELKQISEGLVIDIGSVYDNEVKLRVENQVVATGELVILNDRYGVKINEVTKVKEAPAPKPAAKPAAPAAKPATPAKPTAPAAKPAAPAAKPAAPAAKPATPAKPAAPAAKPAQAGNENFNYNDFEIEDESI